ncbi:MAG: multidrug transporter [Paenibacillaceae bacterium]|jgi:drug/metabolite transporter (DMT)-like permease|nr:multidrug transporter [Paenibacillaceae bacterium]
MKQLNMSTKVPAAESSRLWVIAAALVAVYIFWGGTYLGMKVAIETIPPFIMAGVRFLTAGGLLYAAARLKGVPHPAPGEWKQAGIVGALLLLGGNGVVAWAEQKVPSAIASLLVATVPLWIILLNWTGGSRKRPSPGVILGMLLGMAGLAVLVWNSGGTSGSGLSTLGFVALLLASISWAFGSLYSRTAKLPSSPLMSTAVQMLAGGALLMIMSLLLGDWSKLQVELISLRSLAALGYLILFGSVIGYTAYIWLLKNADPAWVSTYAFVNPIVAVFLGWFLGNEQLGANSLASAAIIIAAVIIITVFGRKRKPQAEAEHRQQPA